MTSLDEIILPQQHVNWSQTDYDMFYLRRARELSQETDDPNAQLDNRSAVGSIITVENELVSRSANKVPEQLRSVFEFSADFDSERLWYVEHAERAAIFFAAINNNSLDGGTIYCTRFPCSDCARAIVSFGLSRLVVSKGFLSEGKWIESQRYARQILRMAKVKIRYLSLMPNS